MPCWHKRENVRRRPLAEPAPPERRVKQTVRLARGYWFRAGVPRAEQRRMAEELHDHLHEATADGRTVEDVVGHDLAAFASGWAQAERHRPAIEMVLAGLAALVGLPGLLALATPLVGDHRTGFELGALVYVGALTLGILVVQAVRRRRFQLTGQQAAWIALVGLVGMSLIATTARDALEGRDPFVAVPASVAWSLVVAGAALQLVAWWLKRSRAG